MISIGGVLDEAGDAMSDAEFDDLWLSYSDPEGHAGAHDPDFADDDDESEDD